VLRGSWVAGAPLRDAGAVDAFGSLRAAGAVAARPVAATILTVECLVAAIVVDAILIVVAAGVSAHRATNLLRFATEWAFVARIRTNEALAPIAAGRTACGRW
jgi:hypothetical protein